MKTTILTVTLKALTAVLAGALMTACVGGGAEYEDPDFEGPEWEGDCPEPQKMRSLINAAIDYGAPPPPFEIYCPNEYAAMKNLK